jgi:hypothetical protein
MPEDKVQREIEELLDRLDTFLPEESVASKVRKRSSNAASSMLRSLTEPLTHISLRTVMLTALVLIVGGFILGYAYSTIGHWMLIAGVVLLLASFVLSFLTRGSVSGPPPPEKHWRGQPMVLQSPGLGDRLRSWFRTKRRRRP